jgi:chloramphenicol-sensitive protein RarD
MNRGIGYAIGAYATWGLFPIYWKALRHVPAGQVLSHRIVWSCLFLIAIVLLSRQGSALNTAAFSPKVLSIYAFSSLLIGANWLTYIWAVNAGYIVEASLGYFLNPLISVLLGVVILGERLRGGQWASISLAAGGLSYLTWAHGALPWIALTLASTFALYGLIKKLAPLGSLHGLTLETALLLPLAALYLLRCERTGVGAFLQAGALSDLLLIGAGPVTTVPLLLFAAAARRIPLSLLGVLQYISPVLQFTIGVLVYHEPFTRDRAIGIGTVWLSLIVFAAEGYVAARARRTDRSCGVPPP